VQRSTAAALPPAAEMWLGRQTRQTNTATTTPRASELGPSAAEVDAAVKENPDRAELAEKLRQLIVEHPYLEPGKAARPHPLSCWVALCRESLVAGKIDQGNEQLDRVQVGLRAELKPIAEAFRRFDVDGSGQLDAGEFKHMCAYLGWGHEEAALMDLDGDGSISIAEFQAFVGAFGGIQQLFEMRRQRVASTRKDVCESAGISVGSRVKAHYYVNGQKSKSWREAVVLAIGVERPGSSSTGVRVEFGFEGAGDEGPDWRAQQVVPPSWIVSRDADAALATTLREIGILEDHQSFWSLVLPPSELAALSHLEGCQRAALSLIRSQATESHEQQLPNLRAHFEKLGFGYGELQATLDWVQDLAPICVHVNIDTVGRFLEVDDYYRSQFETKTSFGAGSGDNKNSTRRKWEHDLFGGNYDEAKDFERCKYGALCVMNDYRGVVTAEQYGDSYMVLKDVRLRCTFASEDSGGIEGSRLAVLDKYAHVLSEFNDEELKSIVAIATSAISADRDSLAAAANAVQLLRGSSSDPTAQWITMGFPKLAQSTGRYYFEVKVFEGSGAPQVGLLSSAFELKPKVFSQEGVGDDKHGWGLDVLNAALWHGGSSRPWPKAQKAKEVTAQERGEYPWQRMNVQERALAEDAVIGVAVDVDKGLLWFSADGEWTSEPSLRLGLGKGVGVYPAVSMKGRAAFVFEKFTYTAPGHAGACLAWPGVPMPVVRIDCPHLGNEELLDCYKEVQIHGEVHLKRNVQRLVADSKYRDKPKNERSLALVVANAGDCNGTYRRAGAHGGAPLYHSDGGGCLYYDTASSTWRLNDAQNTSSHRFFVAAAADGAQVPPRRGWKVRDEEAGCIDAAAFKQAMLDSDIPAAATEALVEALTVNAEGGSPLLFRKHGERHLSEEWEKLGSPPPATAEDVWQKALDAVRERLQKAAGLSKANIVESEHPYHAVKDSWTREVQLEGSMSLNIYFAGASCTYDKKSCLHIHGGGLSRAAAGPGARVEVATTNNSKVWGTVESRKDGVWRVRLDRRPDSMVDDEDEADGEVDELGVPRWPQEGDVVEARHRIGSWYPGVVSDVDVEVDWYTATRRVVYTIDWDDGDATDRKKGPGDVRRPCGQKALEGHHYLEEVPLYGTITPKKVECVVKVQDAPTTVTVGYGGPALQEFELVDVEADVVKILFASGTITFKHEDYGESESSTLGLYADLDDEEAPVEGAYRVETPFGDWVLDGATEQQVNLCARLRLAAERFDIEVETDMDDVLDELCKKLAGEARRASAAGPTIGKEIRRFAFDASCPISPIVVEGFAESDGPAQQSGVKAGWHFDLEGSLHADPVLRESMEHAFPCDDDGDPSDIEGLLERGLQKSQELVTFLNETLLRRTEAVLVFRDCASRAQVELLPEAFAIYKGSTRVSSEIKLFQSTSRRVSVEAFSKPGPAQGAGVRTDWTLDIHKTLHHNPGMTPKLTEEAIIENPNILLGLSDVVLVFKLANPSKKRLKTYSGPCGSANWGKCEVPGDSVTFAFSTDGDGRDDVAKRWGFFAMVTDGGAKAPAQEKLDELATKWAEVKRRAQWVKDPEVQRDDWDEARLRALCAKHGWEFEWKTEDGERRRRAREVGLLQRSANVNEASKAMRGHTSHTPSSASHALPDGALRAVDEHVQAAGAVIAGVAGLAKRRWCQATGGLGALRGAAAADGGKASPK